MCLYSYLLQFPVLSAPVTKDEVTPLGLAVIYSAGKLEIIKYLVKECHVEVNGERINTCTIKPFKLLFKNYTSRLYNCCTYSTFLVL